MSDRRFDQGSLSTLTEPAEDGRGALLRVSLQRLVPMADAVAEMFYGRLFVLDPALRGLFRGEMRAQGRKLFSVLQVAVQNVDRLEAIAPVLQGLGRRHVGYGVRDVDYETVRSALLWTLQHALGDELTPATAAAWADVYDMVAGVMRAAARDPAPSSRAPRSQRTSRSQAPLSSPA
jgi:hemoglobin-like flavoprotein